MYKEPRRNVNDNLYEDNYKPKPTPVLPEIPEKARVLDDFMTEGSHYIDTDPLDDTLPKVSEIDCCVKDNTEAIAKISSELEGLKNGSVGGGDVTDEQIGRAVEAYMAEHPVQVNETDPTVPEWAKQPEKPTYTAKEIGALPADTVIPPAYTLPTASADTLGGVKVGKGLQMDGDVLDVKSVLYEVIETVTMEEDVAAYEILFDHPLKGLYVEITSPGVAASVGASINSYFTSGESFYCYGTNVVGAAAGYKSIYRAEREGNMWRLLQVYGGINFELNTPRVIERIREKSDGIVKLKMAAKFPAGTDIIVRGCATMPKKYINGKYIEMTAEEVAEMERLAAEMPTPEITAEERIAELQRELDALKAKFGIE